METAKTQTYKNVSSALTMFDNALKFFGLPLTGKNLKEVAEFCAKHRFTKDARSNLAAEVQKRSANYFKGVIGQIQTFMRVSFNVDSFQLKNPFKKEAAP
jgi:hypothetical protein